jgi:hypothetical protein
MSSTPAKSSSELLDRLRDDRPLIAVELRPPKSDLTAEQSMDTWIDMYHSVSRLARRDTVIFLTDNAVGVSEEENLRHLVTNLAGDVPPSKLVPGPPRCVEFAYMLRQQLRNRHPAITLGGWANPHREAAEQVGYLESPTFTGEFFLTQIVSHHHVREVERFVRELRQRDIPLPGVFGVFLYRSANPRTLDRLRQFFPVPVDGVTKDFASGLTPEAICAKTILALRDVGVDKVYVSNLGFLRPEARYRKVLAAL